MKNLSLLIISILALALFSCQREEVQQNGELLTITANQKSSPDLKTNIGAAGTTAVTWNETDHLGVFDGTDPNKNVKFSYSAGAGTQSGTFNGTINGWASGSKTFYGVYPYDAANTSAHSAYTITIPTAQTQNLASEATQYAHLGLNDFMAASPVTVEKTGAEQPNINFSFQHLMTILDIKVGNLRGLAVRVVRISIVRAADDFAQTAILDLTKAPGQNYQRGTVTNQLDLFLEHNNVQTVDKGVFTGSMIIAPVDLSGGNTDFVVMVAGGDYYTVTKTVGPNLLAGKRYKALITIGWPGFIDSRDDKVYQTVIIGTQTWMAENLAYLPSVVGPGTLSETNKLYYVNGYNGTVVADAKATANYYTYGVLYNWQAALAACPDGWHLPTDDEFTTLCTYLEGESVAGGKLKETGTTHWYDQSAGTTNSSGFTALPGGQNNSGAFFDPGFSAFFWSATGSGASDAWYRQLGFNVDRVDRIVSNRDFGYTVRCLKDN